MQQETAQPATSNSRILRWILIGLAFVWIALCLSAASAGVGFLIGQSSAPGTTDQFAPLYQTWDLIHTKYVNQPVDDTKLVQGAINGMMESLGDKNSTYMDPSQFSASSDLLEGYEGIGATVDLSGPYLKITGVFKGSPAEQAGLQAGDEIIAVDGQDVTGKLPKDVRTLLMGPAGSHVQLTIRRPGENDALEFDIVRAKIDPPVVESRMLDGGVAYMQLGIFSEASTAQVKEALTALLAEKPKALILDLRGNPGGFVTAVVDIGSEFLPEDALLFYEKYSDGSEIRHTCKAGGLAVDIPLAVLVDGNSASAAEILAGAIQDHSRGTLVGVTTYGKGSVQEWIPLMNNMGAVRITVALWYTPNGRQIDNQGLTPDVQVPLTEDEFQAGQDPQLDAALSVLQ